MTDTATRARNLPTLPVVRSLDMLRAQAWTPTATERAAIAARADFFASEGMGREVRIRVEDVYTGAAIGYLIFNP